MHNSDKWPLGKAAYNWDLQYDPQSPQDAPSSAYNKQSDSNVTFSFYSFLKLPDLPNIPPEDAKFLEMKGCLNVPPRTILDEFIRQYFLHVHPCLPVLNEADFWRLYRGKQDRPGKENSISLFTFQAMLFASCAVCYALPTVICSIGANERKIYSLSLLRPLN